MKILFVMPYSPVPPTFGGALRTYHLIRLAAQHHDVSVLTIGSVEDEDMLRTHFNPVLSRAHILPRHWPLKHWRLAQFYSLFTRHSFFYTLGHSSDVQKRLDRIFHEAEFDIIQTEFPHMASYDLHSNAMKILDAHNVEYDNFRRMYLNAPSPLRKLLYFSEYKKFYREEIRAINRNDALFVTSGRDKQILEGDVPGIPKYIIPNGVDASYFTSSSEVPEPHSLVFTGAMGYIPNYDGMLYFLDNIFPLVLKGVPDAKVYIVGSKPPEKLKARASKHVIVTGYVDDVRPFVRKSSVYIVPLRMGSGTRLKVLEAMAMKKPIVTTSIGCEGIDVVNNESALISDEPQAFADSVIELFRNQTMREKLTANGFELMKAQYEWSVIGREVERLYQTFSQKSQRQDVTSNMNSGVLR